VIEKTVDNIRYNSKKKFNNSNNNNNNSNNNNNNNTFITSVAEGTLSG
jgi:hypothetical protein